MFSREDLIQKLRRIDSRGYKAYKELRGQYCFDRFILFVDYVQGDPFASPSRVRIRVPQTVAQFSPNFFGSRIRRIALQDFLTRKVSEAIQRVAKGNRGTGKSGVIQIDTPGQQVIERTAMVVTEKFVEARLAIGLPAQGRRVLAGQAIAMFTDEIPEIVDHSLLRSSLVEWQIQKHVELAEDQEFIRRQLASRGLVAFVANGSVLPRRSGVSDLPMATDKVVPFQSPPSLETFFSTPNHGKITGMGIPRGVTLIVGGGYHGKSTLLQAIERGIYNHIAGDGREFVITDPTAVKVRAEDGRQVTRVNISPFIANLPGGQITTEFSSEDASGSTSQAANIVEALEMGTQLLLLDEDTSATNFMIRDLRMQKLIQKEREPITPFIDRVRPLFDQHGVSTILVMGGSGDYFEVADLVIAMDEYRPADVTRRAKGIAEQFPSHREFESSDKFSLDISRVPVPESFDPSRGRKTKIAAKGLTTILFGRTTIDLKYVEQLVDPSQTRTIGDFVNYCVHRYMDGRRDLLSVIKLGMHDIDRHGLDVISPFHGEHPGDYAYTRPMEIACTINRMRTLKVAPRN